MSDFTHDLLVHGVAAAKAGEADEAIRNLERLLDMDPEEDERLEACYWLAMMSTDPAVKRKYLEDVLSAEPYHLQARREWMILNGELAPDEIVDPNAISAPKQTGGAPSLDRFTCPQCGGRMVYSPDGSALICEFCESKKAQQKTTPLVEQDFLLSMATIKGHSQPEGQTTYICQGCGAGFILANTALSINCPYCHTPYVVEHAETRVQAAPSAIFPARVSSQSAVSVFDNWRNEHNKPVPDAPIHLEGIYLPAWWFSLGGQIHYRYSIQEKRKPIQSFASSRPVLRSDIIIPASNHYVEELQWMIRSLDYGEMTTYKTDFLADWPAETYQISVGDASLKARQIAFQMEKQEARDYIPNEAIEISFSSHELIVSSYQLILLPAWIGECSLDGVKRQLFINAVNGEVNMAGEKEKPQQSFWDKLLSWANE
jgi:DNA-directed RNA polymerase subunit RPC12/RpoP